ncbi:TPA: helix-turn-helix domain-containing protein [Bacillus cereus]|nr:helix-turn-helix domain-containing protein [Bacillus cereus]
MKKEIITKRQFSILRYLDKSVEWVSSKEIGTSIGCSYKTTQNEVKILKEKLPESWSLLSKKGHGMKLLHPSNETVASRFVHDNKELIFQLIHLLIEGKGYSIEEIGDMLYINRNTTAELLKKVKQMIEPFFLTLKIRPYRIEGNEGLIRLLLFEISYSKNGNLYFHSQNKCQHIDVKIKTYLERAHGITLTKFGMNTFCNFLNICILRNQGGFKAERLPFGVGDKIISQGYFKEFNRFFIILEEILECNIQIEDRMYIYLALIYSEIEYIPSLKVALTKYSRVNTETALEMVVTDDALKQLYVPKKEYMEFLNFIRFLKKHLGYNFINNKLFLLKSFSLYCLSKLRSVSPMLQYSPKNSVLNNITNEYPLLLKEINQIFKRWGEKNDFKFNTSNIMSFTLLMLEYLTSDKKLQPNILFVTSRSQIISDFTLNNMKRRFNGKAKIKKKSVWDLQKSDTLFENVDLIITDTILPLSSKKIQIILIENNFSNKELLNIDHAIDLCMKNKDEFLFKRRNISVSN